MSTTMSRTAKEEPSKKVTKQAREKPPIRVCESVPTECPPRTTQNNGETPTKPKPRQRKALDKPEGRQTLSPVPDTIPKKNAQRAKGSISLNKTTEPVEPDRRSQGRSVEKMKVEENCNLNPKPPVLAKKKKKKMINEVLPAGPAVPSIPPVPATLAVPAVSAVPTVPTASKRIPRCNRVPKNVEKQCSNDVLEERTLEIVEQVSETKVDEEVQAIGPAFNSCSFFERLQQGVRAYFTSRSSCNPEDRSKKEGGIRTRARVAKGVKEDAKSSKSGLEFIKSINNSESDLFYELLRVNSSVGGQSSNFLSTKPKILRHFRKLKRKKLYNPKKHYVRIQIPRKGYFYRSAVRFQTPEPEPLRVLDIRGRKKKCAKVQFPGVASKSPKISHPPEKKRLRKKETRAHTLDCAEEPGQPSDIIPSDYIQELLYLIDVLDPHFKNVQEDYISMNWPRDSDQQTLQDMVDPESRGRERTNTTLENSVFYGQKTKREVESNWPREVPERLDHSKPSWNTLLDCLGSIIGKEQLICHLQLPSPFNDEGSLKHNHLQTIHEEPLTVANILAILNYPDSMDSDTVCTSQISSSTLNGSESTLNSSNSPSLMEGNDLHLELQNNLKAFDSCQNIKSKTQKILQSNFHDNYIPLNIHSSTQSVQTRPEEFRDIREIKSNTSFDSAASHAPQLEKISNEVLHPVKRDSGLEPPAEQHRSSEIELQKGRSSAVKRSISSTSMDSFRIENQTTWGYPFASPSMPDCSAEDSYEKIQPFTPQSTRSSADWKKTNSCIFKNPMPSLLGECTGQGIWKAMSSKTGQQGSETSLKPKNPSARGRSLTLQELIDIYMGVLKHDKIIPKSSSMCLSSIASHLNTRLNGKNSKKEKEKQPTSVSLKEYVTMFQKILQSSLSISQIAQMNNIIANLQDYSEKNYNNNLMKELSEEEKKHGKMNPIKTMKAGPQQSNPVKEEIEPYETFKLTSPVRNQKPEKTLKKMEQHMEEKTSKTPTSKARPKSKKGEKLKDQPSQETIQQIQLPFPTELESILKLGYGSESVMCKDSHMMDAKNKLLVTVKLAGNQVLVSDLSYFTNERALSAGKSLRNGTSELIIENVTNQQIWYKNTKSSRLRILKRAMEEKPKKIIKKNKKIRKLKLKSEKIGGEQNVRETRPNHFKTTPSRFEYNQMKLRAQHPIESIAEISESKVSQVGISDHDLKKHNPMYPPEKKISPWNPKTTKALMAFEKKVHSKSLTWKFGPALSRTKSLVPKPRTKRRIKIGKRNQATIIRSLVDLKLGSKRNINRKVLNPRRTYLCYPSIEQTQTKPVRGKTNEIRPVTKTVTPSSPKPKPPRMQQAAKIGKNPTSEVDAQREELDSLSLAGERTGLKTSESMRKNPGEKSLTNTILFLNSDVASNCCSVEFLLSKNSEEPLVEPSAEQVNPSEKKILETELSSVSSDTYEELQSLNKSKQSPIAIFPPVSCSDVTNVPTEIIHSDSFLINFPSLSVSQTKYHSLLKASSDLKFYPGRVNENGHEELPLVTFVLTPSQNEAASLPENQVKVVSKKNDTSVLNESNLEESTTDDKKESEGKDENDLKAIESFINHMTMCRKAAARKNSKKSEPTKASTRVRPKSQSSTPTPRKMYHECQFKKLEELNKHNTSKSTKENKGRLRTSDVVDKVVINPANVCTNFEKEEGGNKIEKGEEKGDGPPKTPRRRPKYELKSVNPSDISFELVEAVKNAIAQMEGIMNKNEIISAIEEGFSKTKLRGVELSKSTGDLSDVSKKLKMVKIKIVHADQNHPEENPEEDTQKHPAAQKVQLLNSLVSEGTYLSRKNSTYFDALEKSEGEESFGGGEEQIVAVHTKEAAKDKSEDSFYFTTEKLKENSDFNTTEETLFASDIPQNEYEEMILSKISKSLEEGHVLYSMTLLESFLKKVEDSSDCVRLKKLLGLVENKSKELMINMERSAWLKVLTLLEEVTQVIESQNIQDFKKEQLKTAKDIIDKIQGLNINRLSDFRKFYCSFSESKQDDGARGTVLTRIKDSLKRFKEKFLLKRVNPWEDSTLWNISLNDAEFKVNSTVSLPEIPEDYLKRKNQNEKNPVQVLKNKLHQQYTCILELIKAGKEKDDDLPPEIEGLKQKVAEKMKLLEKKFNHNILEEESRESWKRATSLLKLAENCRKEEAEGVAEGEVNLDRSPSYLDLMKCLIKAWDTRMAISSISNECFG